MGSDPPPAAFADLMKQLAIHVSMYLTKAATLETDVLSPLTKSFNSIFLA
jgi:hypothetical protein